MAPVLFWSVVLCNFYYFSNQCTSFETTEVTGVFSASTMTPVATSPVGGAPGPSLTAGEMVTAPEVTPPVVCESRMAIDEGASPVV